GTALDPSGCRPSVGGGLRMATLRADCNSESPTERAPTSGPPLSDLRNSISALGISGELKLAPTHREGIPGRRCQTASIIRKVKPAREIMRGSSICANSSCKTQRTHATCRVVRHTAWDIQTEKALAK